MSAISIEDRSSQVRKNRSQIRKKLVKNLILKKETKSEVFDRSADSWSSLSPVSTRASTKSCLLRRSYSENYNFDQQYDLLEKLGEGAHSCVYKCFSRKDKKNYAVKITKHNDQELVMDAAHHFEILEKISHPNIILNKEFFCSESGMTTYSIQQYCPYKNLKEIISEEGATHFSQSEIILIIKQLLAALQYLHSKGICHRDIKPDNILYDSETHQLKIIDFECAKTKKQSESEMEMWTKTGTLHYQAPQMFLSGIYNEKIDLWAVGIIAFQLTKGQLPFSSNYYHRMVKLITQSQIDYTLIECSQGLRKLVEKLLQKNPNNRISAHEGLKLSIFQGSEKIQ